MPVAIGVVVLIATIGTGYFLEDRYQTIKAADDYQLRAEAARESDLLDMANERRANVAALELAQALSAAELARDIQALRLQNVTWELTAIYERAEADRSFPGDAARKEQLLAQMAALIAALEQ
jgi:hypothetical protein